MDTDQIVVARLWSKYTGSVPSRAPIIVGLNKTGKYKTICIYLRKDSDQPNYFVSEGLKDFYVSEKKSLGSLNMAVIMRLAAVLKEQEVDILHCHRHQAVVYGAIAAWIAGTKTVIAHVHGLNRSRTFGRRLINKIVLRRTKKILTVGQAVKRDVIKTNSFLDDDKVISIGNSIDVTRFAKTDFSKEQAKQRLDIESSAFVIGAIGRLEPTKGFDILLKAFKTFKESIPNAKLIMIGEGKLRDYLGDLCQELEISEDVHFLGRRSDIPEILAAMDMFVISSIAEGMPRVLLEAMVAGVPCVSSNVGAIPEILDDGKYGLMVEPFSVEKLADAMLNLVSMPNNERQQLIDIAKNRIMTDYNHTVVMSKVDEIYTMLYNARQ